MAKRLVVLSGGLDSSTLLGLLLAHSGETETETLTFDYGAKHNAMENQAAKKVAEHYGVRNTLIALPFINELFKSDLLKSGGEVPEGHYEHPTMKRTVVPFRNGIMLAIACGFAESIHAQDVYLGNHFGDHAIYPDCRADFIAHFSNAVLAGTYEKVKIQSPFSFFTKTDIVRKGLELDVPFKLTYSCYKGGAEHCGKCGTCVERLEAFALARGFDPVFAKNS